MMRRYKRDEGTALLATVVFVIIVSILASGFIAVVNTNLKGANRAAHDQVCRALAEAGIEKAAVLLRSDASYSGENWFALGEGELSIEAAAAATPERFTVTSSARYSAVDPRPLCIVAEIARHGDSVRIVRWTEAAP
jgi:hypothetical protein